MKRIWLLAATMSTVSVAAAAVSADDFVWQLPLSVDGHDGVYRVVLNEGVYRHATRADLGDVVASNGAGEEIPFGPVPLPETRPAPPPKPIVPLRWYAVPRDKPGSADGESLALHIERGTDGRVLRLDSTITPGQIAAGADVLLDLSELSTDVVALDVRLDDTTTGNFRARLDVLASTDLLNFDLISANQSLLRLEQNGYHLQRLRLELPATRRNYLLLRPAEAGATLPIAAVDAVLRAPEVDTREAARREIVASAATAEKPKPGEFYFDSGGPFPVERIDLKLADGNAIAEVWIESRDADKGRWQQRANFTAFRSTAMGEELASLPIDIGVTRDRQWRVLTQPTLTRAPTLTLSYRADQYVVMTQGDPPYFVFAGSARETRQSFPLTSMLAALNTRLGSDWRPQLAPLGDGQLLAGEAALQPGPPKPPSLRKVVLWAVLAGGAAFVFYMIARLLKDADAAPKSS